MPDPQYNCESCGRGMIERFPDEVPLPFCQSCEDDFARAWAKWYTRSESIPLPKEL